MIEFFKNISNFFKSNSFLIIIIRDKLYKNKNIIPH